MIRFTRRSAYFSDNTKPRWMHLPVEITYEEIKFIKWVFEVNGKVYTHCLKDFEEEFNKARAWELLK